MPVSVSTETSATARRPRRWSSARRGLRGIVLAHFGDLAGAELAAGRLPGEALGGRCPSPGCGRPRLPAGRVPRRARAPPSRTAWPARSWWTCGVDEETPPTVVEPPEAPDRRIACCRRCRSLMAVIGSPSVSAATCVMMVRVPVPRSWLPISSTTEPSGLIVVRQLAGVAAAAPRVDADAQPALDRAGAAFAARVPQALPVAQLRGLHQLRAVDFRARAVAGVLREDLHRVHLDGRREIVDRAAGQIGGLLVVRRPPGALRRGVHRNRRCGSCAGWGCWCRRTGWAGMPPPVKPPVAQDCDCHTVIVPSFLAADLDFGEGRGPVAGDRSVPWRGRGTASRARRRPSWRAWPKRHPSGPRRTCCRSRRRCGPGARGCWPPAP